MLPLLCINETPFIPWIHSLQWTWFMLSFSPPFLLAVAGVLYIHVHSAQGLISADVDGLSDPYCMVLVNKRKVTESLNGLRFLTDHIIFSLSFSSSSLPFSTLASCPPGAHDPLHSGHPWSQVGEGSRDVCLRLHTGVSWLFSATVTCLCVPVAINTHTIFFSAFVSSKNCQQCTLFITCSFCILYTICFCWYSHNNFGWCILSV